MTEIRVYTKVEIRDEKGAELMSVTRLAKNRPNGSRYFSTFTRGACQENELAIAEMLRNQYGDAPQYD